MHLNSMFKYPFLFLISSSLLGGSIIIDGDLSEPEWQDAYTIDEFYETQPFTLKKYKGETIAYIFSNEDGIYVGFKNFQDPLTMQSRRAMRDEMTSLSEKNSINIDFDGDGQKAFIIAVTLGDSLFDAIKIQSGAFKKDWDGDWIAKTKKYDTYWVSEFYLPWNLTLMKNIEGGKRKINYTALRYRANEKSWTSSAGTMAMRSNYFENLDSLEIDNYTKSKLNFFPYLAANNNTITDLEESNIGAELFYNSGKGSQINMTLNPDFGQAESDDVIINFSAQETFYSEKRAFFNENQSLFNISNYDRYSVINTRRIGSSPSYDCEAQENTDDCNNSKRSFTDIDFALRFTQKIDTLELGVFSAKESDEDYSIGREFTALRSKKKNGNQTFGHMITHVNDEAKNSKSTVNVIDYLNQVSSKLRVLTDILISEKDGVNGKGIRSQYIYKPDSLSRNTASILYFDEDFNLNDFGYLQRNDWFHIGIGHNIQKVDFKNNSKYDLIDFGIDINYDADTNGNSNPISFEQKNEITFKDTSKFKLNFKHITSGKNTTITRKNALYPFVKIRDKTSITLDSEAINYKYWTYDWRMTLEEGGAYKNWDSKGFSKKFFKLAGSVFPNDNLLFKLELRYKKEDEWLKWLDENKLAAYDLGQKTVSINMNWFKGNKHEIRLKSQFVALKAKNPISLVVDSGGYLFKNEEEVSPFLRGVASFQIRYKYEIAPLSNIYLVYTKGGDMYEDDDQMNMSDIFEQPWENPSNEIFSLKFRLKY